MRDVASAVTSLFPPNLGGRRPVRSSRPFGITSGPNDDAAPSAFFWPSEVVENVMRFADVQSAVLLVPCQPSLGSDLCVRACDLIPCGVPRILCGNRFGEGLVVYSHGCEGV